MVIDRTFYAPEPLCLAAITEFEFKSDVWAGLALQGKEATEFMEICLNETRKWIETEKRNRGLNDE